ncbi:hypothetical protein [Polyangium aurulentum]|uniref:hypothetical protein n=1 Tax=Polyangium aurulentum TaxID=2567896 RepID=UPI0010ADC171|nr:hypothetical protein [Polyangium aurulentum]UQA58744.1 hypothetical protein E8A73_047220 [Polyangium aurulentum]
MSRAARLFSLLQALRRLDEVSRVPLGYPHELLAADEQRAIMTGHRWDRIDFRGRTVAQAV